MKTGLYLEEMKIPMAKMRDETVAATEMERKQMMIERQVYIRSFQRCQSKKTERKINRINRHQSFD